MNKQATWLFFLTLLLLATLSAGGANAWSDAGALAPARAAQTDESAMPPLVGGAPKAPDRPISRPPIAAGALGADFQDSPNAPVISVWYGTTQPVGLRGDPQKWVNVLGNVSSALPISSLTYTLNGGPSQTLSVGPDNMRLAQAGDFNIELDYTDLLPGSNQVVITAIDTALASSQAIVTVNYTAAPAWTPQTYTVNWNSAAKVSDVAQVVDGQWAIDNGAARPTVLDFDRLLAIGDLSWRDYTVTVPITVYSIDPSGYTAPSNGPGVGVMVRWQGHQFAEGDTQPRTGWRRLGALGWYRWKQNPTPSEGLQLLGHRGLSLGESTRTLSLGTTYLFKLSVTSNANPAKPSMYRFKVWDAAQAEPATWDFEAQGNNGEPRSGSVVLLAHHVDARFGNVTVELASVMPAPTLTTNISGTGSGVIERAPNKTTYRFGEDVTLTVVPNAGSTFLNWLGDLSGNTNPAALEMFGNRSVTAVLTNPNVQTPISDDFSGCGLNTQLWTYIDPQDDSPLQLTGSQAQISVAAGATHDIWTGGLNAPRIMQYAENEDFEIEAKFDSAMNTKNQGQGILVQGDAQNLLRYNFLHDGTSYRIQAYTFLAGAPTERVNQPITIAPPMYLRVKRIGNVWNLLYSANGTNWTLAAGFQHDLVVTGYGPYVSNSSKNPAMAGLVDYFFNTKSPIIPEDNDRKLNLASNPPNGGTVERSPLKDNYACDETVTLTPVPAIGYKFDHWSGDLTGTANPGSLVMNGTKTVTAHFVTDVQYTVNVSANGAGTVAKSPDQAAYSAGSQVTLTATPAVGNLFAGWSGDVTGSVNPITVTVNGNMTVVGNFAPAPPRTLTVNVVGNGSVTRDPIGPTYLHGQTVTLTAVPAAGASFLGWSGALSGATSPTTLIMDADKTVTATFADNIYTLTLQPGANGTITASPAKPAYYQNEPVTLTATPQPGYKFLAWGGDLSGSANPATLVMTKNSTVSATFVPDQTYTIDISVVGSGSVIKDPAQTEYNLNDQVTLTATPGPGMEFVGWSGDLSGSANPATVTVTGNMAITATFAPIGVYSLTIVPPNNGTIQVDPVRTLYAPGETVTLTAVPNLGYVFAAWGNDATGTTNPFTLIMDGNKTVSAVFESAPIYTVNVTSAGNGSVAVDPAGTQFTAGTQITLTATAETGYFFAGWSGDLVSSKNPYVLTVDGNKNIVANFTDTRGVISDDFAGCGDLNPTLWTWTDPLGGADYEMTSTQLRITVPPGPNYEVYNSNNGARVMQDVSNTPFSVVVRMESPITAAGQSQGILIEGDDGRFIRIDLLGVANGSEVGVKFFAATVENGQGKTKRNFSVTPGADPHILVRRVGDEWRLFYRGTASEPWESQGKFTFVMSVASVGVFVGSPAPAGGSGPGHTALFDYFFAESESLDGEDANAPSITINKVGQGNVTQTPAGPTYACGQSVQLTATPAGGWRFQNWSVDLNGVSPTQTLIVTRKHTVTATFVQVTSFDVFLPVSIR